MATKYVPPGMRRADPNAEMAKLKANTKDLQLRVERVRETKQQVNARVNTLRDIAANVEPLRARAREIEDAEFVLRAGRADELPELAAAGAGEFRETLATLPSDRELQELLGEAVRSRASYTRKCGKR
jgi:hypothetical protein